jgi:oligo-1,6-glucosidase
MKDPVSHFVYDLMKSFGLPGSLAFRLVRYAARDHSRVPMAWDDSVNGGFNQGAKPWQCVNPNYRQINVQKDLSSDRSIYRFYQKLLKIRKENDAAIYGRTIEIGHENKKILAYCRAYKGKRLLIAANFSKGKARCVLPEWTERAKLLISNYDELERRKGVVTFRPYQAVVFEHV